MSNDDLNRIIDAAEKLLNRNSIVNQSKDFLYTCPNPKIYPHQWLWDSAFHAIVWSYFDLEKSKIELLNSIFKQFDSGMIPHMTYWIKPKSFLSRIADRLFKNWPEKDRSYITQPPVIAKAVEIVYNKSHDKEWLGDILNSLYDYFMWFDNERNVDHDGLVVVIHPWETGMDMLPVWDMFIKRKQLFTIRAGFWLNDLVKKYNQVKWDIKKIVEMDLFVVKDVSFNCIYIQGLYSLAQLFKELDDTKNSNLFLDRASKALNSLEKKCWNSEYNFFFDLYSREDKQIKEFSISGLFPIILDVKKEFSRALIEKHLLNTESFWPPYPIPTVPINSPKFNRGQSLLLWRGPTWINTNWYLIEGLFKQNYKAEALNLLMKTIELVQKSGFWEYYNPFNGKGLGAKGLGWSTLVVDLIKRYLFNEQNES